MRRKYNKYGKRKTSIRTHLFRLINKFERWYYPLPSGIRHITGLLVAMTLIALIGGTTYMGYRLAVKGYNALLSINWGQDHSNDSQEEYSNTANKHFDFPLADNEKHPKRRPQFGKDFAFINDVHLQAAIKLGIEPQDTREDLEKQRSRLVELRDTRYYELLPLTSSSPYLVPRAADFLTALGRLLQEYNGTTSRFYISSVLRTQEDVNKLGRINGNASKNSTHCYGTTIDITYSRFDIHGHTTEGKLKEDLARALYDLQAKGYCYVKYEVKQPCFHVTVRP